MTSSTLSLVVVGLDGVVIGGVGVDGTEGNGGCADGVVILEGGLTVGLAVLQTLG